METDSEAEGTFAVDVEVLVIGGLAVPLSVGKVLGTGAGVDAAAIAEVETEAGTATAGAMAETADVDSATVEVAMVGVAPIEIVPVETVLVARTAMILSSDLLALRDGAY